MKPFLILVFIPLLFACGRSQDVSEVKRLQKESQRLSQENDTLKRRMDAADQTVVIIDTRSALDVELEPFAIRGALRIPSEEIAHRHHEVPRDRDVVLYCT